MTMLRFPEDADLHEENGTDHIDPGKDRNLRARLKRHLDAHHRDSDRNVELGALAKEWFAGDQVVTDAIAHRDEVRTYVMAEVRRLWEHEGVKQAEIAAAFKMNERTVRDYLQHGKTVDRSK